MTTAEFFQRARKGRTWLLVGKVVRCADGYCPLGAVAKLKGRAWDGTSYPRKEPGPTAAAKKLRLNIAWAWRIAFAADVPKSKDRPWLLKNLGIS